ncbi:WD40-repeat-containing domain protein [Kockovaella imperatae]|uniref:Pre-rRNA-processing protein IPI3 n=1 Tax=Kockovaella imperatae TaxID=4999 RepID=A0A1Y1ULZ4_9TREE|nr:WD40-repeat-containing domain protein [Kockovaella imperatae]ORX39063.1 WD40-repeat-containing domain protein [Kockovaella imperatae]
MSQPQELILSACAEASSSSSRPGTTGQPSIYLHDLSTCTQAASLKPSSKNGIGGGVLALQEGKAIVNVWTWQKDQLQLKLHMPEKLSCFTVSPNGCWAAGGSSSGHMYLWEISSGSLHSSFTVHYRQITSLTFTPDSRLLLSSSLDASSHVFLVSQLVDPSLPLPKPYGSFSDHTLPVLSVCVSRSSSVAGGRAFTCSEDGTVKLWDLYPPFTLLSTFALPAGSTPVQVVVDPMERFFYVAANIESRGQAWHVPLYKHKEDARSDNNVEAVGGGGFGEPPVKLGPLIFESKSAFTSMTLSISASHLLVGTDSGEVSILSIPSHQLVRTLNLSGPVTHLSTMLRPPDLGVSNPDRWTPLEVKAFERLRVGKSNREAQDVVMALGPSTKHELLTSLRPPRARGSMARGSGDVHIQKTNEHLAEILDENKRLRASLDKAVKINDKMWKGVVDLHLMNE